MANAIFATALRGFPPPYTAAATRLPRPHSSPAFYPTVAALAPHLDKISHKFIHQAPPALAPQGINYQTPHFYTDFHLLHFYQPPFQTTHPPNMASAIFAPSGLSQLPPAPPSISRHLALFIYCIYPPFKPPILQIWQTPYLPLQRRASLPLTLPPPPAYPAPTHHPPFTQP